MDPDDQWNVFVPQQLWGERSGFLSGSVDFENGLVYVSGVSKVVQGPLYFKPVGFWQNGEREATPDWTAGRDQIWVWVTIKLEGGAPSCSLFTRCGKNSVEKKLTVCITFNPHEVMKSYILNSSKSEDLHHLRGKDLGNSKSETVLSPRSDIQNSKTTEIHRRRAFLGPLIDMLTTSQIEFPSQDSVRLFYLPPSKASKMNFSFPLFLTWVLSFFENILKIGARGVRACCSWLPKILQTPSTFQYFQEKISLYKLCFNMDRTKNLNIFLLYNCYSQQLLDSCLGLSVIVLVTSFSIHHLAAELILDWADGVASQLSGLVEWLMGAPAGLKLNAQLTNFLGHFFIYHIYLWTGYLSLLRGSLASLLWYSSLVGILGVSAQVCLLCDLLSMLTLHIYCFYVYAAKIFSLQVYMMGALWRLFRGKKWNVLRRRVDSAIYSTEQLFVGTLFFTVLLFLLPTTALYYAVFTLLRLSALSVQGCLACVLDVIMAVPAFTLLLKLFSPKLIAGNVTFKVQASPADQTCLVLHMQTSQLPLRHLLKITGQFFRSTPRHGLTWLELATNLSTGQLVYPWVESHTARLQLNKED